MRGPATVKDEPPEEAPVGTSAGGCVPSHSHEAFYQHRTFGTLPRPEDQVSISSSGNLDLPPSPPPLPPIFESEPESETSSPQLPPSVPPPSQITNEPPLKRSRTTRGVEMEAPQMDMDNGDQEVLERSATAIAPPPLGSDTRDSETAHPPEIGASEAPVPPETQTHITGSDSPALFETRTPGIASETLAPHGTGTPATASGFTMTSGSRMFEFGPYTNLLPMPLAQHKVSAINTSDEIEMKCISHRPQIQYHSSIGDALKRLGLYQVCRMGHTTLRDRALIRALVERWRPETHTFHMPVGEMTITLQDVSCLMGLPISGIPIVGISDFDWSDVVLSSLGVAVPSDEWRVKGFSIKLSWLRKTFKHFPEPPTPAQVEFYTRAYILDFFGSVLFPTTNGDDVPVMYLPFLFNLNSSSHYNWGSAVLAYLYRGLSIAARKKRKTFNGCLELLQMWSWTRFAVSKPEIPRRGPEFEDWGLPNLEDCQPYGKKWTSRRLWRNPHNSCTAYPRDILDKLQDDRGVVWTPYIEVLACLPLITQLDQGHWLAKVPLIHFWIVAHHYPDRVMRQFGYRQTVPPPAPVPWIEELKYQKAEHSDRALGFDWRTQWVQEIDEACRPQDFLAVINGPHDDRWYSSEYMLWYHQHGMWTVNLWHYNRSDLTQPRPPPTQPPAMQTYLSQSDVFSRIGMRSFKSAVLATKQVITRGLKKVGKAILLDCRGNMADVGQLSRFRKLIRDANLPEVIEDIPVDDDDTPAEMPHLYCDTDERWNAAYEGSLSYDDLWIPL